jgi:serine/threonine-protein kinase
MASTRQAPSILTKYPSLPPAIAAVVDRALAFNRMARYANAGEMKLALSRAVHESGMTFAPLAAAELTCPATHDPSENPTTPKQRAAAAFQPTATVAPITTDSQSARKSKAQVYVIMGIAAFAGVAGGAGFFFFGAARNNSPTTSTTLSADETPPSTLRSASTLEVSAAPSGEPTPTVSASAQPTVSAVVSVSQPTASAVVRTTAAPKTATPVATSQPTAPQPPKKCDPFKEYCK